MAILQEIAKPAPNPALARGRPASPSAGEALSVGRKES
jgi:hypothetical protein